MTDHERSIVIADSERVGPRGIVQRVSTVADPRFSLCVMVTDWAEYDLWFDSFTAGGFTTAVCEFLVVDNSQGNRADAYVALNEFLQVAQAEHIVLVHHDVRLLDHGIRDLEQRLEDLTRRDDTWAVCGNAGGRPDGWPVANLSHPWREHDVRGGPFPARAVAIDENFMIVRRVANLALSRDLAGFHHYAADLCTVADVLGWTVYVIDFYLRHDSGGTFDDRYEQSRFAITKKWSHAFRGRWIEVATNRPFYVSGSAVLRRIAPARRQVEKLLGRRPRSRLFLEVPADDATAERTDGRSD